MVVESIDEVGPQFKVQALAKAKGAQCRKAPFAVRRQVGSGEVIICTPTARGKSRVRHDRYPRRLPRKRSRATVLRRISQLLVPRALGGRSVVGAVLVTIVRSEEQLMAPMSQSPLTLESKVKPCATHVTHIHRAPYIKVIRDRDDAVRHLIIIAISRKGQ